MKRFGYAQMFKSIVAAAMLVGAGWLAGCVTVPEPLRSVPGQGADPAQVREAPQQYAGMSVRWGGVIVSVENGAAQSLVMVVSRPLSKSGRPLLTDETSGRFIARINSFVDPLDYAAGREITVVGTVEGTEQRTIGQYPYSYPVVKVSGYYLWPPRPLPMPDPYYYSPFYNPWYPYGPYHYPYYPYP